MNKMLKMMCYIAVMTVAFAATNAFAQGLGGGDDVFATILTRMVTTFQNVRSVVFVLGGFGLVGLAFAAIFGKVQWKWLGALAAGLAVVAVAGAVIDYVTQSDASQQAYQGGQLGDTLYD